MGFRVSIFLQQLSPSKSGVRCPQPPCKVQGNMCHVTLDHGDIQGGTCPRRVTSPYMLQSSRSLQFQHSWSQFVQFSNKHLQQIHAWLGRSPHSSISSLLTPFPPAWLLPPPFQTSQCKSSFLPQATWWNPILFQTALILNA